MARQGLYSRLFRALTGALENAPTEGLTKSDLIQALRNAPGGVADEEIRYAFDPLSEGRKYSGQELLSQYMESPIDFFAHRRELRRGLHKGQFGGNPYAAHWQGLDDEAYPEVSLLTGGGSHSERMKTPHSLKVPASLFGAMAGFPDTPHFYDPYHLATTLLIGRRPKRLDVAKLMEDWPEFHDSMLALAGQDLTRRRQRQLFTETAMRRGKAAWAAGDLPSMKLYRAQKRLLDSIEEDVMEEIGGGFPSLQPFFRQSGGHFSNRPDLIGWYRTETAPVSGRPDELAHLLIEAQSDVHKTGAKRGYTPEQHAKILEQLDRRAQSLAMEATNAEPRSIMDIMKAERAQQAAHRALNDLRRIKEQGPASRYAYVPFQGKEWANLAARNFLLDAAEKKADYLAIPYGKQVHGYEGGRLAGHKHWYENVLPNVLRKELKSLGIKSNVEDVPLRRIRESYRPSDTEAPLKLRKVLKDILGPELSKKYHKNPKVTLDDIRGDLADRDISLDEFVDELIDAFTSEVKVQGIPVPRDLNEVIRSKGGLKMLSTLPLLAALSGAAQDGEA